MDIAVSVIKTVTPDMIQGGRLYWLEERDNTIVLMKGVSRTPIILLVRMRA